jgi:hypothetical protein
MPQTVRVNGSTSVAQNPFARFRLLGYHLSCSANATLVFEKQTGVATWVTLFELDVLASQPTSWNGEGAQTPNGQPGILDLAQGEGIRVSSSAGTVKGFLKYETVP